MYMPDDLKDTWVVTNTTTEDDLAFLAARGVSKVITTTPRLDGRSFGTNVMEALLVAAAGSKQALAPAEYLKLLRTNGLNPSLQEL
jgi:hypothetical protein